MHILWILTLSPLPAIIIGTEWLIGTARSHAILIRLLEVANYMSTLLSPLSITLKVSLTTSSAVLWLVISGTSYFLKNLNSFCSPCVLPKIQKTRWVCSSFLNYQKKAELSLRSLARDMIQTLLVEESSHVIFTSTAKLRSVTIGLVLMIYPHSSRWSLSASNGPQSLQILGPG